MKHQGARETPGGAGNTRGRGKHQGARETPGGAGNIRGCDSVADPSYTVLTVLLNGDYILCWSTQCLAQICV